MFDENKSGGPTGQRPAVPTIPPYDNELLALAKYEWLKQVLACHRRVSIEWAGFDEPLPYQRWHIGGSGLRVAGLWEFVRDFPHEWRSIWFQVDDDPDLHPIPWDDSTPQNDLIEFLDNFDAHDWRNVIKRRAPALRSYVMARVTKGKRSDIIFKIAMTLRERGASVGEIKCVLRASRCWQDKHGIDERRLDREIKYIMSKRPRGH